MAASSGSALSTLPSIKRRCQKPLFADLASRARSAQRHGQPEGYSRDHRRCTELVTAVGEMPVARLDAIADALLHSSLSLATVRSAAKPDVTGGDNASKYLHGWRRDNGPRCPG
jgi:hypothetical protein